MLYHGNYSILLRLSSFSLTQHGDTTRKIIRVYSQQTHRGIRPRRGIRGPFFSHSSSSQGIYRHLRYLSINNSTTTTDREKWDFAKSIVVARSRQTQWYRDDHWYALPLSSPHRPTSCKHCRIMIIILTLSCHRSSHLHLSSRHRDI